jgi:hypothetical protein
MPEPPTKVQSLMREFQRAWFIAGGWAIDLFLGKTTREHDDIEIAIFRKDQIALQKYLSDWNLRKAANGELSEWKKGEYLELPVHAVHCFNETAELSFIEVLLNESENGEWQFRRNRQITKPLFELYLTNDSGIKYLCPEVVLLYKSKNPRAKDEKDFRAVGGHLSAKSKKWLKDALLICARQHHWLQDL